MDTKRKEAFHWKKEDVFSYWNWSSHDLHDLTWLEREVYNLHSRWELPLHRGETGIHDIQLQIQRGKPLV